MLSEPPSANQGLLLVGGVDYDVQPVHPGPAPTLLAASGPVAPRTRSPAIRGHVTWEALSGTKTEVAAVRGHWQDDTSVALLSGAEAGETAVRELMPGRRYIHLATHGFFASETFRSLTGHDEADEVLFAGTVRQQLLTETQGRATARNPLVLCGVVLAGANLRPKTDALELLGGDDGILTAEKIIALDLRGTELVTLSACETGIGKVAGGEGVMGLARAFHLAGARNVVASLWKVDDQATAALMRLFYYNLWKKKMGLAAALRGAQLTLYRHPEQIGELASSRGPKFEETVVLGQTASQSPDGRTAPRASGLDFCSPAQPGERDEHPEPQKCAAVMDDLTMNIFPQIWSTVVIIVLVSGLADKAMAAEPAKAVQPRPADKPAPIDHQNIDQESRRLHEAATKLQKAGKFREALPLAEQAVVIRDEVLGPGDVVTTRAVLTLALLQTELGQDAEAERHYLRVRETLAKTQAERPTYAVALGGLSILYARKKEYEKAEPLVLEARDILKKACGETDPAYATALQNLASLYSSMGQPAKGVPFLAELCQIRKKAHGEADPDYAMSLCKLGMLYGSMGEYAKGEPLVLQARDIWKKTLKASHPNYAVYLRNLAGLCRATRDYTEAGQRYRELCEILKKAYGETSLEYARRVSELADPLRWAFKSEDAERLLLQVAEIYKKALGEAHPDYAASLCDLALLYTRFGQRDKAEPLYLQALHVFQKSHNEANSFYAICLTNLAAIHMEKREYAKADLYYAELCSLWKMPPSEVHPDYADGMNSLARAYQSMGDFRKAEPLFVWSAELHKRLHGERSPEYAVLALNDLASFYHQIGDYPKAERLHLQALEIYRQAPSGKNTLGYATSLGNLSNVYQTMGDYAKAEPLLLEARAVVETCSHGMVYDPVGLANLASLYQHMGEYAKAESLLLKVCNLSKPEADSEYAWRLGQLGGLYSDMGDLAKAERLLLQALDILKKLHREAHPDYASKLNDVGRVYLKRGEYAKAEPFFCQARDVWKNAFGETHPAYVRSLNTLAELYVQKGELHKAEPLAVEALTRKLRLFESLCPVLPEGQAREFLGMHGVSCDLLLDVYRSRTNEKANEAYTAVWTTCGLLSDWSVERLQAARAEPAAAPILGQLRQTQAEFAQLVLAATTPEQREARRKRLAELNERKEALELGLAKASREFRQSQETRKATPADLMNSIGQRCAVVEFLATYVYDPPAKGKTPSASWRYEAFVLRSSKNQQVRPIAWVSLGERNLIDQAVVAWRAGIVEGRPSGARIPPEQTLRKFLWEPLEPHLAGCKAVYIVPDGMLNFLPWAALPGRSPGTVLLEDYAVATASSGKQLYALLSDTTAPNQGLLAVGGVAYDTRPEQAAPSPGLLAAASTAEAPRSRSPAINGKITWSALPGTKAEVAAIGSEWHDQPPALLLEGPQAGENALRAAMPGRRYIHLATHGFFADEMFHSLAGHDESGEELFASVGGEKLVTAKLARAAAQSVGPIGYRAGRGEPAAQD